MAGQLAAQSIYGMCSPAQAVLLSDEALAITSVPCAGRMHAIGGKGQALSLLGRKREVRQARDELDQTFERLPRDITRQKISTGGWAEERLHHFRSFTATFGGIGAGERAREEALALYSLAAWRGPAQIKLHRAAAERDAQLAIATLLELSEPQRNDRSVRLIAMRVLEHVDGRGAVDLHELLA